MKKSLINCELFNGTFEEFLFLNESSTIDIEQRVEMKQYLELFLELYLNKLLNENDVENNTFLC